MYTVGVMTTGGKVWTDRGYTFRKLPSELEGGVLFSGPQRIPSGSKLTLNGGQDGTMYALLTKGRDGTYKNTLSSKGWRNTGLKASWGGEMEVYSISSKFQELPVSEGGDTVVVFGFVATTHPGKI